MTTADPIAHGGRPAMVQLLAPLRRAASGGGAVMIPLFAVLLIVDVALQPTILQSAQLGLTIQTALPLVLVSIGQCMVLLTGGIDVSVGGMMVVANVLLATWVGDGGGAIWRLIVVLALGAVLGAVNGLLVTLGGFEPFVATLGTWAIYNGIALLILPTPGGTPPVAMSAWVQDVSGAVSRPVILLIAILLLWWFWRGTRLSKSIYAVGSDEQRAGLSGVRVVRTKFVAYAMAGFFAGLAGIYLGLVTATGDASIGDGYILSSIEACVLGGVSLTGGYGGAGLAVAGAFVLTFINGITSALVMPPWVAIVVSAALLLAVIGIRSRLGRRSA